VAAFAAYQVVQGFRTGSEKPIIRGFYTSYSRATQPKRYWASMTWNILLALFLFFGAITMITSSGVAKASDQDANRCFDKAQRYSAEDELSGCDNLIQAKIYIGKDVGAVMAFRGATYQRLGDDLHAIRDLTEAIRLRPEFEEFELRGLSYMRTRQYVNAVDDFSRSIRLNPGNPNAFSERALARHLTGDDRGALEDLSAKLRQKPDDWVAYYDRGTIYMRRGDESQAIADLSSAIRLRPAFPEAYYNRAIAYERKGEEQSAQSDRSEAIRLRPDLARLRWPPPNEEQQ
jgi:tetratricopeptide (TPR) repeat protein